MPFWSEERAIESRPGSSGCTPPTLLILTKAVSAMSLAPPTTVALDLRGVRLSLERDALMELPESVLLCLFPNGVVLSPQRQPGSPDENEEDVYFVDVSR